MNTAESTTNVFDRIKELHDRLREVPDDAPQSVSRHGYGYRQLVSAKTTEECFNGGDTFYAARILQRIAAEEGDTQIAALDLRYVMDYIRDITNRKEAMEAEKERFGREMKEGVAREAEEERKRGPRPIDPETVEMHEQFERQRQIDAAKPKPTLH